jgi:hypothetical protein
MRRLSLTLLVALLAFPAAALAARADKGDGVFELKAASGTFILNGGGVLIGQMDKGTLRVQDMNPNDGQEPAVSGAEHSRPTDDPNTTLYWGSNIHFRITQGKYRIRFKGSGVDLTAVGVGIADITANPLSLDAGTFSLDGGKWTAVPLVERFVPYGVQPSGPTSGP